MNKIGKGPSIKKEKTQKKKNTVTFPSPRNKREDVHSATLQPAPKKPSDHGM